MLIAERVQNDFWIGVLTEFGVERKISSGFNGQNLHFY